jgi:hypothetical protein
LGVPVLVVVEQTGALGVPLLTAVGLEGIRLPLTLLLELLIQEVEAEAEPEALQMEGLGVQGGLVSSFCQSPQPQQSHSLMSQKQTR